jgi:hypothetical protein
MTLVSPTGALHCGTHAVGSGETDEVDSRQRAGAHDVQGHCNGACGWFFAGWRRQWAKTLTSRDYTGYYQQIQPG